MRVQEFDEYGVFAVADSVGQPLTYKLPFAIEVGAPCVVPVLRTTRVGVFLGKTSKPEFSCKAVLSTLPYVVPFGEKQLALLRWVSDYYLAPLGRCVRLLAPGFLWDPAKQQIREKRFLKLMTNGELVFPAHFKDVIGYSTKLLNDEQSIAVEKILAEKALRVTVLQGVTGSGKTEVYIEIAKRVVQTGKAVLILVPEIALTPQTSKRFFDVFGADLGVLHSGLTAVEYERQWFRANHGQTKVLLGVRSAVFAPLKNIGLIVVDEEHDGGYKSDEFPCYHARDVAVKRAHLEDALCVLGSATPSLESDVNVRLGRYAKIELTKRAVGTFPSFEIIDARESLNLKTSEKKSLPAHSSFIEFKENLIDKQIVDEIQKNAHAGQQSMVILNRRGFANFALCGQCGQSLKCPHCSVSTTLHKRGSREVCHYCGFQRERLRSCDACGSTQLFLMGAGTQNIESELQRQITDLKIARLDRDVMTSQTRLTEILSGFRQGDFDCLVGTQILAKGHDFPRVTLVVVLYVEDGLLLPDFRSGERTFQLLTQAAGRAGRGTLNGRVLLQSLVPLHPVIDAASQNDVNGFLARESELRSTCWHPPYCRQILFEIKGRTEGAALTLGNALRHELVLFWKNQAIPADLVRIAGPYPAALEKLKNEYRFQLCISAQKELHPARLVPFAVLSEKLKSLGFDRHVRCDVDPYSFL